MLRLGPVRIGEEELRWMRWGEERVVVELRWTWEEVPVLLDLHGRVLLRWEHLGRGQGGYTVYIEEGTVRDKLDQSGSGGCVVRLELRERPEKSTLE